MKPETPSVASVASVASGAPDLTLLLSHLERKILSGSDPGSVRAQLTTRSLWEKAGPELQLRWAELAQMAGEIDTALEVLDHVNHTAPDQVPAWAARLEILKILDDRPAMVRLMAAAKATAPQSVKDALEAALRHASGPAADASEAAAVTRPFDAMRQRQALLQAFLDLFSGKEDAFARQWVEKEAGKTGYVPVRRPMEISDVEEHLSGRKTYGIYLMRADGQVALAVLDADLAAEYRQKPVDKAARSKIFRERDYLIARALELSRERGFTAWAEFSGAKGFHFWFFFDPPVPAAAARAAVSGICRTLAADISTFSLEVFPKQDAPTGKGFGNLVKLPLGVHRKTGKRSYFLACADRSPDAQLYFVSRIEKDRFKPPPEQAPQAPENLLVHPRWENWAKEWPELHTLGSRCPPLAALFVACRNRRALSQKETKVLFQTVGFLPRAKSLMHYLMAGQPDYNPHQVDFRLSRLRGTPLGCRRVHSLLDVVLDMCAFEAGADYAHPLLHLGEWEKKAPGRSEKAAALTDALDTLKAAIIQVERFLKTP